MRYAPAVSSGPGRHSGETTRSESGVSMPKRPVSLPSQPDKRALAPADISPQQMVSRCDRLSRPGHVPAPGLTMPAPSRAELRPLWSAAVDGQRGGMGVPTSMRGAVGFPAVRSKTFPAREQGQAGGLWHRTALESDAPAVTAGVRAARQALEIAVTAGPEQVLRQPGTGRGARPAATSKMARIDREISHATLPRTTPKTLHSPANTASPGLAGIGLPGPAGAAPQGMAANRPPGGYTPQSMVYRKQTSASGEQKQDGGGEEDIRFFREHAPQTQRSVTTTVLREESLPAVTGPSNEVVTFADLDAQTGRIADKVYKVLERRLRTEKMRRGLT